MEGQMPTGSDPLPGLRVSEAERDKAAAELAKYCGEGRLTLEEFSQRVGVVLAAKTQADIDTVMSDMPRGANVEVYSSPLPASGWFVAVLSGSSRKGRWRPKPKTKALAFMGGIDLDLRKAEIEGSGVVIRAIAIMGGIQIVVPEGVNVHLGGFSLMGGKDMRVADVPILPGSPVIRVQAFSLMGGVHVRTKRARSALPGGPSPALESGRSKLANLDKKLANLDKKLAGKDDLPTASWGGGSRERSEHRTQRHRDAILDARDGLALASEILDRLSGRVGPADRNPVSTGPRMRTAPDGTVTILFSDMSGFTEMTERLGDVESQQLLAVYFQMVRGQATSHGGYEVKCQADEAMLAFSGAGQALRCAIEIQRSLARYRLANQDDPIHAHIGLHTGEAIQDGGDFLGRTVILASRITDVARADEILASALLRELAAGSGDLSFGPARDASLQGVADTQTLYPVIWS
jgi:class 3 adenylate cyclase